MPKQNPDSPQSVFGKISSILDQFTVERTQLTLAEITANTNISKTTVFRLLQEMVELGYISQTGKSYELGVALFRLGMVARQRINIAQLLGNLLAPIAEKTAETIITATLSHGEIIYLHVIESPNPLRFVVKAGAKRSLPFGATGMALLSQLDVAAQTNLLDPPFSRYTDKTITDLPTYLDRLRKVRQDNLVVEHGEYYDGIMALAIPVPSQFPLTFTVVGPEERILPMQGLITTELQQAAEEFRLMQGEFSSLRWGTLT